MFSVKAHFFWLFVFYLQFITSSSSPTEWFWFDWTSQIQGIVLESDINVRHQLYRHSKLLWTAFFLLLFFLKALWTKTPKDPLTCSGFVLLPPFWPLGHSFAQPLFLYFQFPHVISSLFWFELIFFILRTGVAMLLDSDLRYRRLVCPLVCSGMLYSHRLTCIRVRSLGSLWAHVATEATLWLSTLYSVHTDAPTRSAF